MPVGHEICGKCRDADAPAFVTKSVRGREDVLMWHVIVYGLHRSALVQPIAFRSLSRVAAWQSHHSRRGGESGWWVVVSIISCLTAISVHPNLCFNWNMRSPRDMRVSRHCNARKEPKRSRHAYTRISSAPEDRLFCPPQSSFNATCLLGRTEGCAAGLQDFAR